MTKLKPKLTIIKYFNKLMLSAKNMYIHWQTLKQQQKH